MLTNKLTEHHLLTVNMTQHKLTAKELAQWIEKPNLPHRPLHQEVLQPGNITYNL